MIRCGKNWLITGAEEPLNLPRSIFGTKPVLSWVGRFSLVRHASPVMRIHPVISIAQLEPSTPRPDPYDRQLVVDPSPIADGDTEAPSYEIERLIDKRITRDKPYYLVEWKGYDHQHNVWYSIDNLNDATALIANYEAIASCRSTRTRRVAYDIIARTTRIIDTVLAVIEA